MDWQGILVIALIVVLTAVVARRVQAPRSGTERLALAVWSAFGPYATAAEAEAYLRRASSAVFGHAEMPNHEEWLQGYAAEFQKWETEGSLALAQGLMRKGASWIAYGTAFEQACARLRQEMLTEANDAVTGINEELLEAGGHRLELVTQPDGSVALVRKKIWSDEAIARKRKDDDELILRTIGTNIIQDNTPESLHLLEFLGAVAGDHDDAHLTDPIAVGRVWSFCFQSATEEPDSDSAIAFKYLNSAWTASRSGADAT